MHPIRALGLVVALGMAGWLPAPPASALGFVLEDGETIEGAIVEATRNTIIIRRADGGMRQLPADRLQRVRITTAGGEVLGGAFAGWHDGRTGIETGSEVVWIEADRVVERTPLARPALAQGSPRAPAPGAAAPTSGPPMAVAAAPATPAEAATAQVAPPAALQAAPEPAAGPEPVALPARDLPVVTVTADPDEVTEATGEIVFTVELSRPVDELLVVIYATVDGAAHAGTDYAALQGILTIPAGVTRSELRTAVLEDREPEGDEEFNLFLAANPDLTTVARQWTRVTIRDND